MMWRDAYEIRRLGENRTQRLDRRIVAATNWPLDAAAAEGRFRRTCSTASTSSG